jgi:hypothetical protein
MSTQPSLARAALIEDDPATGRAVRLLQSVLEPLRTRPEGDRHRVDPSGHFLTVDPLLEERTGVRGVW